MRQLGFGVHVLPYGRRGGRFYHGFFLRYGARYFGLIVAYRDRGSRLFRSLFRLVVVLIVHKSAVRVKVVAHLVLGYMNGLGLDVARERLAAVDEFLEYRDVLGSVAVRRELGERIIEQRKSFFVTQTNEIVAHEVARHHFRIYTNELGIVFALIA